MTARRALLAALLALAPALPAHALEEVQMFGPVTPERTVTLRTTTDIGIFAPVVQAFLDQRPGTAIRYEQWGSNALHARTREECDTGRPQAHLVISSGVHQMVSLVNALCAAPWRSEQTARLPEALRWRDEIWGISREAAVMVYNRALVAPDEVPRSRFDLLDLLRPESSRFAGRVATYDIEESGLGFLFAFMDSQEASTFGALMEAFARSGAVATCCSAEIIDGVESGAYLIAYNVLGSYAEAQARGNPDIGIVAPADYTLVLSRAAILPGRVPDPEAAAFLDFLLSDAGQRAMAEGGLTAAEGAVSADIAAEEDDIVPRPIPLGPPMLVAMDPMKVDRFIARWRATFAR